MPEQPISAPYSVNDPLLSLIGQTPYVEFPAETAGTLHIKVEKANPTGSMKDRIALGMILEMREEGTIGPDDTIVEASSGNTAGAVAFVANRLGHECIITTPSTTTPQKMGYVTSLGAELATCPPVDSAHDDHYRSEAKRIADTDGHVFLNQYQNQLNPTVHEKWTGPELWEQAADLTHIVCPMGTGGTLSGIAKYVTAQDPSVTVIGVDAEMSNISTGFYETESVDYATEIEGLGKGSPTPTMWFDHIDEVVSVSDETALSTTRSATQDHGLLIGTSSGAALSVARQIADEDEDASVALIACDGAEQYFDQLTD